MGHGTGSHFLLSFSVSLSASSSSTGFARPGGLAGANPKPKSTSGGQASRWLASFPPHWHCHTGRLEPHMMSLCHFTPSKVSFLTNKNSLKCTCFSLSLWHQKWCETCMMLPAGFVNSHTIHFSTCFAPLGIFITSLTPGVTAKHGMTAMFRVCLPRGQDDSILFSSFFFRGNF